MNVNPLYRLIAEGEHQQQDFKFCINDSRKIAKSLVAFANSDGGRLLIGVKDNGRIAGVRSDEEYYMVEAAANIYSKPKVKFETKNWQAEGKTVLEIYVPPSEEKPHYAKDENKKWLAYIRKADENILANTVLLKSWEIAASSTGMLIKYDESREKILNFLKEYEAITLSKFTKIARIHRKTAEIILAEFIFMECLIGEFDKTPVTYRLNENFNIDTYLSTADEP